MNVSPLRFRPFNTNMREKQKHTANRYLLWILAHMKISKCVNISFSFTWSSLCEKWIIRRAYTKKKQQQQQKWDYLSVIHVLWQRKYSWDYSSFILIWTYDFSNVIMVIICVNMVFNTLCAVQCAVHSIH